MYQLLLAWRYLRTRWIALASIVSVTLGVATLIVVNSVMAGFAHEMQQRMNGVLSDIVLQSHGNDGFADPEWHIDEIKKVLGDDVKGVSASVETLGMLSYKFRGRWINRQVEIIGVDEATYGNIGDVGKYLLHPENRKQLSFQLREEGYFREKPGDMPEMGWKHRRMKAAYERAYQDEMRRVHDTRLENEADAERSPATEDGPAPDEGDQAAEVAPAAYVDGLVGDEGGPSGDEHEPSSSAPGDPFASRRRLEEGVAFDAGKEQRPGIILGFAMCTIRQRAPDGAVNDYHLCVPGDDIRLTFARAGSDPKMSSELFTVVDYYESKMSEYDQKFAIVKLSDLQRFRGMIDPASGIPSVTSIQIRLKPGADLESARARLQARFPAGEWPFRITTWREMQGNLLAAVQMETTLLNILLFMIIAVAGFGILSTFFMIVVEKTKDIGVLKSLGATSAGVRNIFLTYGLSLGAVGGGVGAILGLLFVANINGIAKLIELVTGQEVFDPTIYYFSQIPTIVQPFTVAWVVAGAVLIAVLASVLPAVRAARMHPVEALRYE